MRRLGIAAAAVAAAVVAGCGGGGTKPAAVGSASIVPDDVAAFVAVDTDLDSAAWNKTEALLDRFPGKDDLLSTLRSSLEDQGIDWETDLKPALGHEIDFVWLDFADGGGNVVGLTKPKDVDKFDALLEKGSNPAVHEEIEGWTVFAEDQARLDRFEQLRSDGGSLEDDSAFQDAMDGLPADSIARAFVSGRAVQGRIDRSLEQSSGLSGATESAIGTLESVGAAVTPQSDGIRIDAAATGDLKLGGSDYHAALPASLPAGAILYLSFNDIGSAFDRLLRTLSQTNPNFDQQRAQIELALGLSLDEIGDLLSGEGAFALYRTSSGLPTFLVVFHVRDEDKASRLVDRLGVIARASGDTSVRSVQIGSVQATEFGAQGVRVLAAVFDGNLVFTNARAAIEGMLAGASKLGDDTLYKAAVSGAGVPSGTHGFFYANLGDGLKYLFDYVERQGGTISSVVRDNVAPLRGLLLYSSKEGDTFRFTGFLGIE